MVRILVGYLLLLAAFALMAALFSETSSDAVRAAVTERTNRGPIVPPTAPGRP